MTSENLHMIKSSIRQLDEKIENFEIELSNPELFSMTQPIFFEELENMYSQIKKENIKGDIIEIGVWNGGTAVYLKALIDYFNLDKKLWLFDVFDEPLDYSVYKKELDQNAIAHFLKVENLVFPKVNELIINFKKFHLYDSSIQIIKGDIFNTHTSFTVNCISILRIDIDLYESTYFVLENFYPKLEKGGFVIIDDYGVEQFNCKNAVDDFRQINQISKPLKRIGDFIAYWQK